MQSSHSVRDKETLALYYLDNFLWLDLGKLHLLNYTGLGDLSLKRRFRKNIKLVHCSLYSTRRFQRFNLLKQVKNMFHWPFFEFMLHKDFFHKNMQNQFGYPPHDCNFCA